MPEAARRYEILLYPRLTDEEGHPDPGEAVRSGVVEATGRTGASGYPRYEGDGFVADIDPATRTVEAVTVDGEELDYGWVAGLAAPAPDDGE
ncbi:hypothetical protein [Streptomyces boncukensis]|uniref:Uncharacterized protein n=1 Tax=Streptomyces boncukensis TaxID=2711219 RepID=A0A6G4X6D3_9ACTN|nr:hypothetical protein [Streptomyces boncukensis]NGO72420.1 hypothetical protein [Streptomyces boncukensis]